MLLDLFLCFVQVGLFSIGGGYAAMPMIQAKAVEYYHWLTMGEFTDLMTIAEMTPGPITVNSATFVGIRMAGIPGALVATMGCILPSLIIVSLLSWLYEKYRSMDAMQAVLACLRPAVVALIASAALTILRVVVFAGGVVSAEAVQMFDVARSRLMCCSRIWSAMRRALLPIRSTETPMMRPGMLRLNASRVVM